MIDSTECKSRDYVRMDLADYLDQRFGMWSVIGYAGFINGEHMLTCKCDCGEIRDVRARSLRKGISKSCGCRGRRANISQSMKSRYPIQDPLESLNSRYKNMVNRCTDPNSEAYPLYGGRGIRICDEWLNDKNKFIEWSLANGFDVTLTLDRIDVDGNYCPENCRWVTWDVQNNNKRDNAYIEYDERTQTIAEWAKELGMEYWCLRMRLHRGWSIERALTTPPMQKRSSKRRDS